jgi:hypothetical protein
VKKKDEVEIPECYFERNPLVVITSVLFTTTLVTSTLYLFYYKDIRSAGHGVALALSPVAIVSLYQTLLFILNPFALLYKDKMEIKKNMFSNKIWYFNDIERVSEVSNGSFNITYNDGEVERLELSGIKPSHLKGLRDELHKHVYLSLEHRDLLN